MADRTARLRRVNLTWKSSGVQACREVDLDLVPGEIHALVGENGAGKTTLGHILAGIRVPDTGVLSINGRERDLAGLEGEILPEIGLVRQQSIWPGSLKVWEAAILGRRDRIRKRKAVLEQFRTTAESWNLSGINPESRISTLDAASLQRGELVSALMHRPDILILDEPASAWEAGRSREFHSVLEQTRNRGIALLLITHRIDDVFRLADRVTVMRHGEIRETRATGEVSREEVVAGMFGEGFEPEYGGGKLAGSADIAVENRKPASTDGQPALMVNRLSLSVSGRNILNDVSLEVRPGEILAVTGLREEGLAVLEDIVTGNRKPGSGDIYLSGRKTDIKAHSLRKAGMRYIPSDKTGRGASLSSTMAENMMVLASGKVARRGILKPSGMKRWTESRRKNGRIDGHAGQKLGELSGGNIQKVILEREFHGRISVIVAADPTWGLDERSRSSLHLRLRRNADEGTAVLLLASDLDEALENADRLAVMSSGELSEIRSISDWSREEAAMRIASGSRE